MCNFPSSLPAPMLQWVASCSSRSGWAVLGLRWPLLFLHPVPLRPQARIPSLLPVCLSVHVRVRMSSSWLMMSLHPPPATCLSAGSEHGLTSSSRSCPQVDDEWLVLRGDHVMICFLESVHTDQCSQHWSYLNTPRSAQIGPPVDGYVAFLLDLISSCACPRFSSS